MSDTVAEDTINPNPKPHVKGSSKKVIIAILFVAIFVLIVGGAYAVVKNRQHKKAQQTKVETQAEVMNNFQTSSTYKELKPNQQLNVRLAKVAQFESLNDYQSALNELSVIKKDIPSAEKSAEFLMYQFIANYQLNKQPEAIDSAHKFKALGQAVPVSFTPWKDLVTQYAAK